MKAVVDRIVQYANRYQLTNVETGEVLGTFDFEEVTGTVQQVGTEIDKELFDSIANDLAARVKLSGGELAETIVTFPDISDTAANVASGEKSSVLWGKVKNWFSRLKALAFKNKVAAGDFEAGAIKNADVAADAAIAQSKVSGLMTDYVASISVSGRTVTYKNKNGVNMGSITTQDTTYGLASQSSNGLMSSTDKTKLDGIESGAQKNTVLGVKGSSESAYRTGNVNITKANIGLGNVDNTSDEDKPVSTATQAALNGKANTSGTYPNLTAGKATSADNAANAANATNATNATKATQDASGNVITSTYATKNELSSGLSGKANTSGSYPNLTVGKATNATNADNATNAANATKADAIKQTDTRSTNELPTFYYNKAAAGQNFTFEFKESAAIGLTGQSTYCQLQTYAKWTDSTGGNITQVAVVDTNYFIRTSTGSTGWGAWKRLLKEGEIGAVENATNATNIIPNENGVVNPLGRKDGGVVGNLSTALGKDSTASGEASTALGREANASGGISTALGATATASGTRSTALGYGSNASGDTSIALGYSSKASNDYSIAIGRRATASASYSVALGYEATASDLISTAIGRGSTASGSSSTALGNGSTASGTHSTALGYGSNASAKFSTALGYNAEVPSTNLNTMQLGDNSTLSALRCRVNLTVTSDKRDKTDIEDITDALAFIERLNPVTFVSNDRVEYISDEDKNGETFRTYGMCEYDRASHAAGTKKGERRRCGLLAQEVVEAMQSVYGTDNYANVVNDNFHDLTEKPSDVENKYTLAYANLVPFLISAIKELNAKINALNGAKED